LQKLAKASAFVRYPLNSRKRKAYRAQQIEALELGRYIAHGPAIVPAFRAANDVSVAQSPLKDLARPSVSAIVPNYNHARFLETRLRSIADQGLQVSELIVLDDASTDDSRDVIERIAATLPFPVRTVFNETNSGSIFHQWTKGLSLARGDLVWICESDDSCDAGFLQAIVPYFNDPSVMLAFGRVAFIDADGSLLQEKNGHLDSSQFWSEPRIESAFAWFHGPFGTRNIIANVGGCVFRRQPIGADLLSELTTYRICGDWFLYSRLARSGRIAYEPSARAYFRLHGKNSSVASLKSEAFYDEHIRIATALRRHYGVEAATLERLLQNAWMQCGSNLGGEAAKTFAQRNPLGGILSEKRTVEHILIIVPANSDAESKNLLARHTNAHSSRGADATVLIQGPLSDAEDLRALLAPSVPIVSDEIVDALGPRSFLRKFGISTVISNAPKADDELLAACRALNVPYTLTFADIPESAGEA
jgi:glycosyltransferase involved in cell wall biosynthesis